MFQTCHGREPAVGRGKVLNACTDAGIRRCTQTLDNGRYSIIQFLRAASNHGGLNLINVHTVDDAQEEEASAMDDMTAQTGGPVTQQNENLCEICMVNLRFTAGAGSLRSLEDLR